MIFEEIGVECYGGYKADERPVAFTFRGRRRKIAEIVDRWYEGGRDARQPELDYFRVLSTAGETFLIRYNKLFDRWAIVIPEQDGR